MRVLAELEALGYTFSLTPDGKLHYRYTGADDPPEAARELLRELKRRKEEAVRRLASRQQEPDYKAEAGKAAKLLQERGWCAVESRTLGGEVVLWVRDNKVAIPEKWKDVVRYTLKELEALTRPPVPEPEGLKQLHEAKRVFKGRIEGVPHG